MEERLDWFLQQHCRESWWIWALFVIIYFFKWKYMRENYWFHSPIAVTLNFSSTGVNVFWFTWRPHIFKRNNFPPPQCKLHIRLFLGSSRLVSSETALQKGGKLGFIGEQFPFSPKLVVVHHNGISNTESSLAWQAWINVISQQDPRQLCCVIYFYLLIYSVLKWRGLLLDIKTHIVWEWRIYSCWNRIYSCWVRKGAPVHNNTPAIPVLHEAFPEKILPLLSSFSFMSGWNNPGKRVLSGSDSHLALGSREEDVERILWGLRPSLG